MLPERGADLVVTVVLSAEEASNGCTRIVSAGGYSQQIEVPPDVCDMQEAWFIGMGMPGANGGLNGNLAVIYRISADICPSDSSDPKDNDSCGVWVDVSSSNTTDDEVSSEVYEPQAQENRRQVPIVIDFTKEDGITTVEEPTVAQAAPASSLPCQDADDEVILRIRLDAEDCQPGLNVGFSLDGSEVGESSSGSGLDVIVFTGSGHHLLEVRMQDALKIYPLDLSDCSDFEVCIMVGSLTGFALPDEVIVRRCA